MIENIIVIIILAAIVGGILVYLYKARKRGENCIGCPYAKQCASKETCGSGDHPERYRR